MGKKPIRFYAIPTQDPSFNALQKKWYGRLKKEGFEDAEDSCYSDRPLKKWSGISSVYVTAFQPPESPLVSSFPDSTFKEEQRFQNHPEFNDLCVRLCDHGNSRLTPQKVRLIWQEYCDGKTLRYSEARHKISDSVVYRVIQKITEWMGLMETRPEELEDQDYATIVLRPFDQDTDTPLIYATWRNALWYDEKRDDAGSNGFFSKATHYIRNVLRMPTTKIRIACAQQDPDFVAGYSVIQGSNLEWIYLKVSYRDTDIVRLLTKGIETTNQPTTKIFKKLIKPLGLKENHGTKEESTTEEGPGTREDWEY